MSHNWKEVQFKELYAISSKNGLNRPSAVRGSGYKMINMGEIFANDRLHDIDMELVLLNDNEKKQFQIIENDLIFARQSLIADGAGKCSIVLNVSKMTCFESHIIRVRLNKNLTVPLFYYYYFQSSLGKGLLSTIRQQGVQAGIRGSDLSMIKIDLPSLPTQHKIAKILSNYDDLIENNLKRIKLLEESARLTYEEWFLRCRIDGKKLDIDPATDLPFGWELVKLGDFLKFKKGKKADDIFEEKKDDLIKLLLLSGLGSGEYTYVEKARHVIARRGDILMTMDGARSSVVFYSEDGAVGSTMSLVETGKLPKSYLYLFFKSTYGWLEINNTGAAIPHANKSFINKMKIIYPGDEIFTKWDKKVSRINNQVFNLKDQNQLLKEARDILLPRLMTGMINTDDMGIAV
jgi:type I restriction enzyme S subunit